MPIDDTIRPGIEVDSVDPDPADLDVVDPDPVEPAPADRERRGRAWLMWSFVFCPCHLPVSVAVLGFVFGGTAFGALVTRNTLSVGVVFGVIYAIGLAIGFRHIRAATRGVDCADGECRLP